jgi:KDO2-lipid IV(A) lauroyltransferase
VSSSALVRAAEVALPLIPGGMSAPLAEMLGSAAYLASPRARANVLANLRVIAPEQANAGLVRRVFIEQARNYLEVFHVPRTAPQRLIDAIEHRGWEHFLAAEKLGRGVVVASAHLGPISVVGQMLNAHGYAVVLPIETEHSDFQRAVNRARRGMGLQLVSIETPLAVYRALRDKKVFGVLADRAVTGVGERVPFFGRETLIPSAHIALALRAGAPVVPGFSGRENGRLTASFEPPLDLVSTGDRDADVRDGVRKWAQVLEKYVRRAPDQWTVFEPVWPDR